VTEEEALPCEMIAEVWSYGARITRCCGSGVLAGQALPDCEELDVLARLEQSDRLRSVPTGAPEEAPPEIETKPEQ
jgi:hypothetical protein